MRFVSLNLNPVSLRLLSLAITKRNPSLRASWPSSKNPSTTSVGVSSRTRARKAVSDGNEPARETTVVSLSVDSESEDMSAVSFKMAVLFFLGRVIRGHAKDFGPVDPFILRIVEDLDVCRTFPWGRLTFEDAIKNLKHMMELLKGEVHSACGFPGFIIPLERYNICVDFVFECIPNMGKIFRLSADRPCEDCPRMCKSRFTKSSMKGYLLEDIYAALGHTKVINSVLVPTVGEKIMLARIIDEEPEYHCEGSTSDTWNHWLNVKQKKIFWKELYDLDVAARVFKKKDKEKVTFLEDSSSNSVLESLKALEERILGAMSDGFSGLKLVVETKLGDMDVRMSKFKKNQRQLRRRANKIKERLTSIESKKNEKKNYGEDMDFGQWDDKDYGRAEGKENSEKAKEDKGNSESSEENVVSGGENSKDGEKDKGNMEDDMEQDDEEEGQVVVKKGTGSSEEEKENEADKTELGTREEDEVSEEDYDTGEEAEKRRVEADVLWRSILSEEAEYLEKEAEKVAKGTPTPPRGRPKRLAARKIVLTPPEEFLRGPAVTEPSPIETEKEAEEMATVVEEEGDKYTDEEKQMWALVVYKASEEMADGTNEVRRDGTNEVRTGFKLRCKQKIMMYGKPRKVTAKKRHIPSNESAPVIARTPREKGKPQWLQSPYTQVNTEDIDGPKKKRKTKAK
uniref:DUF287 domain-containing protein n=1 Tax=Brassica oleracea TaxID=3712 RepID=A0A3P6FNV7_BRAOL|nr:unnamed protein product [Brassica oleracea]